MRRYILNDTTGLKTLHYDVVIIGSGLAGLYAAYSIDENLTCAVISKTGVKDSSSYLAQGGIATALNNDDTAELHFKDTLNAGAGMCDANAVRVLVNEGIIEVNRLIAAGIHFDEDENGHLHFTKEGGHTKRRIVHCDGDSTGKGVVSKLSPIVKHKKNITFLDNTMLVDIITYNDQVCGITIEDNGYKVIKTSFVIIATGGIGQVYQYTTNPKVSTGDGIAAAIRAGAKTKNMGFVQFHPTVLYVKDNFESAFLISEALRGEGAKLYNIKGERFMEKCHEMAELAPRDIAAREITRQIVKAKVPYVYLDITSKSDSYLKKRFPNIYKECKKHGIDISKDQIPICPAQHYFMGGIKTDLDGLTNIKGLYACGEAACTGVHGANRLASNSLLECLVFGRRCADSINHLKPEIIDFVGINNAKKFAKCDVQIDVLKDKIKTVMTNQCGIIRNEKDLTEALSEVESILNLLKNCALQKNTELEVYNMATVAKYVLKSAINRKESIGAHYRID